MRTVKFYKTIFRFNLFNLPINHHKLITPLSKEFIRMELRLQWLCIRCIVIFLKVHYCLLNTKRFELNWFNVAVTTTGRLGLRWLPTVSWKVGYSLGYFGKEKPVKRARTSCVHLFLVYCIYHDNRWEELFTVIFCISCHGNSCTIFIVH